MTCCRKTSIATRIFGARESRGPGESLATPGNRGKPGHSAKFLGNSRRQEPARDSDVAARKPEKAGTANIKDKEMRLNLLASCAATALLISVAGAAAQNTERGAAGAPAKEMSPSAAHQDKAATPQAGAPTEHRSAAQDAPKADMTKPEAPKADMSKPGAADESKAKPGRAESSPPSQQPTANQDTKGTPSRDRAAQGEHPGKNAGKGGAAKPETGRSAATGAPEPGKATDRNAPNGTGDKGKAGMRGENGNDKAANATIDPQKQDRIRTALGSRKVENITRVDFNVAVGTRIPARYRFHPLPVEIVDIVPEYRGYEYIMVQNDIVIVNPQTRAIVYTMNEGRSAGMNRPSVDCR
jgi:hypothetical protein